MRCRDAQGDDQGPFVVPPRAGAAVRLAVPRLGIDRRRLPPRARDPPHGLLQLGRRSDVGELHPLLLVKRRGDAGDSPDLRVGDPPRLQLGAQERQLPQAPGDPHPLARRRQRQAKLPGGPVGARQHPGRAPRLPGVELAQQPQDEGLARRRTRRPGTQFVHQLVVGQGPYVDIHPPTVGPGSDGHAVGRTPVHRAFPCPQGARSPRGAHPGRVVGRPPRARWASGRSAASP